MGRVYHFRICPFSTEIPPRWLSRRSADTSKGEKIPSSSRRGTMIREKSAHAFQSPLFFVLSVILSVLALSGMEFRLYPRNPVPHFCIRTIFEGHSAREIDRT